MVNPERRSLSPYQRIGLAGGSLLSASATFTEVGKLGNVVTWRLPVNFFGLMFMVVYIQTAQKQPSPHRDIWFLKRNPWEGDPDAGSERD